MLKQVRLFIIRRSPPGAPYPTCWRSFHMADCELDESASQPAQTPDDTTPAPCAPDDMSTDRMDTDADSAADGATHSSSSAAAASPAAASTSGGASTRVSAPGSRPDGRLSSELRPLSVEHSPLSRADGSAHWSSGGTSVLVGVYGPLVTGAARDEKHDRATIVVNFKAPAGMASQKAERATPSAHTEGAGARAFQPAAWRKRVSGV